jgi:hypothetical protein
MTDELPGKPFKARIFLKRTEGNLFDEVHFYLFLFFLVV